MIIFIFIAFLYVSSHREDSFQPIHLTSSDENEYFCSWSPDGKKIAFLRIEESGRHLRVVNADGKDPIPLTHDMGNVECWDYDWSPDGKRIVFSANVSGEMGIWVMNADGSDKMRLTLGTSPKWVHGDVFYLGNNSYLHRISLSGKAELIVKDAVICYSTYGNAIVYKNLKGLSIIYDRKKRELTTKSQDLCPYFSSDGKIAFTSERTGNELSACPKMIQIPVSAMMRERPCLLYHKHTSLSPSSSFRISFGQF